jgi:peptidyl-prolyl cis-trans isomerase C
MKKKNKIAGIFLLFAICFQIACQKRSVPEIEIIAQAGEEYLTREELSNWMPSSLPEEQRDLVARRYIDRWIEKTLMAQSAKNEGLNLSSYEKWSLENLQKELLAQKYLNSKLPKDVIVTDEEITSYYEENKEQFIRNKDEVHLIQLFLENRDRAITAEINELKSLEKVIKKNYLDTQFNQLVEKNGDIGYVPVESLRREIINRVKSGKTGRIYGPIKIENGYYYFQMMDKQKKGSFRSLDLVKEEIRLRLSAMKREKLAKELAEKLIENFEVKIYPEHI